MCVYVNMGYVEKHIQDNVIKELKQSAVAIFYNKRTHIQN